jgi:uncharacterized membrane protein YdjX (TVP38/TMEM64 family)
VNKKFLIGVVILLVILTGWVTFSNVNQLNQIQMIVQKAGWWGYLIFVIAYAIATLLILPVTAFNIAGGALYGGLMGLLLTTVGALVSALLAFILARSFKFSMNSDRWAKVNKNLVSGGISYSFAARLLPLIPYGVVSFAAGLSPIKLRDYLLGTLLGTPLGIAPFVFLGSKGVQVRTSRDVLPLLASGLILAMLTVAGTWYQQHQEQEPNELVKEDLDCE